MSARRIALGVAGLALGAAALALALARVGWSGGPTLTARVSWAELRGALGHAHPAWLFAFLATNASSIPLRALQLRALARRSDGSSPDYLPCLRAVASGILAHNLLPARLGEAARAVVLARDGRVSLPHSAAALVVGRALDLVALLAVACALPAAAGMAAARLPSLRTALVGGALLAVALAAAIGALWIARAGAARQLARLSPALGRVAAEFGDGLASVANPRRLVPAACASLGVPLVLAASVAFALLALDIEAPTGTALVFTGVMLLGVAVPSAPSSLGVYHALAVFLLAALGVPISAAVAFAIVSHATSTAMNCAIGALALGQARLLDGVPTA